MRLAADGEEAGRIMDRARKGTAAIESVESEIQRMAPPPLYDLTELQRHANRLFGFSAQRTLDVAQALYERHKLISYPRTDSRHLSQDVAATLPRIVQAIAAPYQAQLAPVPGSGRWGGVLSTTPRSPITTPLFPRQRRRGSPGCPPRNATFTT
jgi:DNA topoisomerase-3